MLSGLARQWQSLQQEPSHSSCHLIQKIRWSLCSFTSKRFDWNVKQNKKKRCWLLISFCRPKSFFDETYFWHIFQAMNTCKCACGLWTLKKAHILMLVSFHRLKRKDVVTHNQLKIKYKWGGHHSLHTCLKYPPAPPNPPRHTQKQKKKKTNQNRQSNFLRIVSCRSHWWKSETYKEIQSHQALINYSSRWPSQRKEFKLTWHSSAPEYTSLYLALSSAQMTFSSLREQTWRWTWQWQHWAMNHHAFNRMEQKEDGYTLPNVIS